MKALGKLFLFLPLATALAAGTTKTPTRQDLPGLKEAFRGKSSLAMVRLKGLANQPKSSDKIPVVHEYLYLYTLTSQLLQLLDEEEVMHDLANDSKDSGTVERVKSLKIDLVDTILQQCKFHKVSLEHDGYVPSDDKLKHFIKETEAHLD